MKIFSSVWLHYENCSKKYFHVFGNILKILFSITTHTKPTTTKTTKTPPQQQQKSKSHKNQNRTKREIGSWVSGEVKGSELPAKLKARGSKALVSWVIWALGLPAKSKIGSWVHGAKALGRRRSRRLVVAGDGLSLSLSLSLSLCFPKNEI